MIFLLWFVASCKLTKQIGDCEGRFARWYYSQSTKTCLPFYYTGCNGNTNSYDSREQCEEKCPLIIGKLTCKTYLVFCVQ